MMNEKEFKTAHDFRDHYWIEIKGIMIVWEVNDWRISATVSEKWEEYLFSRETSFFLPDYVLIRDITRSMLVKW